MLAALMGASRITAGIGGQEGYLPHFLLCIVIGIRYLPNEFQRSAMRWLLNMSYEYPETLHLSLLVLAAANTVSGLDSERHLDLADGFFRLAMEQIKLKRPRVNTVPPLPEGLDWRKHVGFRPFYLN